MAEALNPNVKLIGRYSILRELRRERYTVVYVAFDPVLNRELVVKAVQLRAAAGQDPSAHDRIEQAFMRQAQAAGRLHHPHIVTVFDAGRFASVGYLALECVDGTLLDELLAKGFRPGFLHAADIVARVADAIEYAHSRGVPHGHLGASRIYLHGAEKLPKVMGFGGWIDSGSTGDFELAGTQALLPYFRDDLSAQARQKDVRALGALLFLLLTGTRPDLVTLRERRGSESVILEMRPTAPLALAEIADAALELNGPAYSTAAQMRNALTTFLWGNRGAQDLPAAATITGIRSRLEVVAGGGAGPATASIRPALAQSPARRRKWALPAAAVVAALAAAGWLAMRPAPATGIPASIVSAAPAPALAAGATEKALLSTDSVARTSATTTRFGAASGPAAAVMPHGTVAFAVSPSADVFVDGRRQGTTPPLSQLRLPAGVHTIELRTSNRPAHVVRVEVSPDRPQAIRHSFD